VVCTGVEPTLVRCVDSWLFEDERRSRKQERLDEK
jgi:hypothetical protein